LVSITQEFKGSESERANAEKKKVTLALFIHPVTRPVDETQGKNYKVQGPFV